MRIAMVSATLGDAFGQERVMRISSEALRANGHKVVFIGDQQTGPVPPCEGFEFIPGMARVGTLTLPHRVRKIKERLIVALRRAAPDVVHLIDSFDFRLMEAITEAYPTVHTAHTVSPTCPASTRFAPNDEKSPACREKSGWRCFLHQKDFGCLDGFRGDLRKLHAIQTHRLRQNVLKRIPVTGAISEYVRKRLLAEGWDETKVSMLQNPVDPVDAIPHPDAPENLLVIAARLVPIKGIEHALVALSKLQNLKWTLWICGEGPEETRLREWVVQLSLSHRVKFKGRLPCDELFQAMKAARFLIQTNVGPEGFGLSIAEALTLGTPVVGFDTPALDEIVDNRNGILVPTKDTAQLTKAMERILLNPELREQLSQGAKQSTLKFSRENHLRQTLSAYQAAIAGFRSELGTSEVLVDVGLLNGIADGRKPEKT